MDLLETVFYWLAFNLYILAWAASLGGVIFRRSQLSSYSAVLALLGLFSQTVSLTTRWVGIGHPPLFGSFENSQAAAWFLVAFNLFVYWRYPKLRLLGAATYLWVPALLLWGLTFSTERFPLTISEQSLWVDFHVLFAWLAFSSFLIAWGLALLHLAGLPERFAKIRAAIPIAGEEFRELLFRFLAFGFVTFSVMLALGSVYEFFLFGLWWQWDVVETISLITWLLYGLIIHLLLFYRRTDNLAVWLTLLGPVGLLTAYFGIVALTRAASFHNFDLLF